MVRPVNIMKLIDTTSLLRERKRQVYIIITTFEEFV